MIFDLMESANVELPTAGEETFINFIHNFNGIHSFLFRSLLYSQFYIM